MPASANKKKKKGVTKARRRDRLSTKRHAAHAGERIRAVLHCLANSCGARLALKATRPESTELLFPNETRGALEQG